MSLADNGWRFVSALETELGVHGGSYLAGKERAILDETVANATLKGFTALSDRISALAAARLDNTLSLHRTLFYATIGIIILIALFIFRPMSDVILRKTHELMDARNSMAFLAVHDGLTGLHNRAFLSDHFDTLIKGAQRRMERMAVVQIDLDRFKQINDTLGHAAGDYVLVVTAQRMRESCRTSDICVRLGGDEFVMILQGAGTTEDINMVARRIMERINRPIAFQGTTILPGASAGIAVYPVDADNANDLVVHADLALYAAKKQGGGAFSFFSEELRRELEHRKQLEHDMRVAIEQKVLPGLFPAAGFAGHRRHRRHRGAGALEPRDARHDPARRIHSGRRKVRPDGGDRPHRLLEGHPGRGRMASVRPPVRPARRQRLGHRAARNRLRQVPLRHAGSRRPAAPEAVAGNRRIRHPRRRKDRHRGEAAPHPRRPACISNSTISAPAMPRSATSIPNEIDRLKIDRRFVQNINANGDNTKIVRAITELARGLGISIIAEGAETEAELTSLKSIGCDQVQGYSIAFPMPTEQAQEWLQLRSPKKPQLTVVQGNRA